MIITRTPYRLSFFGGGTDYNPWFEENGGLVLAVGLAHYCHLTVRYLPPFFEHKFRIIYSEMENTNKNLNNSEIVFEYLKGKATPLTAYEILNGLRSKGMVAPTTIYRALEKLLDSGRIHKIESLNAWTVCCENHNKKTAIFEICDECGNVTEHLDSSFTQSIKKLSKRTGFLPNKPILEIHGQCANCTPSI